MKTTKKIAETIASFGIETCCKAYHMHSVQGEGAYMVGLNYGELDRDARDSQIRAAGDRLIAAGRFIVTDAALNAPVAK